jgi:hypothetical protein
VHSERDTQSWWGVVWIATIVAFGFYVPWLLIR